MQAALRIDVSHPYRTPPELDAPPLAVDHDDSVLGVLLLVLGGFRVAAAAAVGEIWSAEPTIALFMIVCGLGLLLPRRNPLLDVFYVGIFLVLFMLAFGIVDLLEKL
jgi:hypothetical protein